MVLEGPRPILLRDVPEQEGQDLKEISSHVTYGWGMIPVMAKIGKTEWKTSLFPIDGSYIVPLKVNVRKAENLSEGEAVTIRLAVR